MLKKIGKLGLVGLLSLGLAGCATIYTPPTTREAPAAIWRETGREKASSKITYSIGNLKQEGCTLDVHVTESKEDKIKITMVADAQTKYEKTTEYSYENKPAINIPVKFSGMLFDVDNKLTLEKLTTTNSEGIARVEIGGHIIFEYFDDMMKEKYIRRLKKGMKQSFADKISMEEMVDTETGPEHKLDVTTIAKGDILLASDDNLEFVDAERRFYVQGRMINPSKLFSYIENLIKADLETKYMPRSVKIRVVGEDHCPVDAIVDFKAINTLSFGELLKETEKIKENYLVKGEEMFGQVKVDPFYLLYNLDGKTVEISREGLEIMVNVPSKYELRVRKEGYVPVEGLEEFTEKNLKDVEIEMGKLSTNISIKEGRSTIKRR